MAKKQTKRNNSHWRDGGFFVVLSVYLSHKTQMKRLGGKVRGEGVRWGKGQDGGVTGSPAVWHTINNEVLETEEMAEN